MAEELKKFEDPVTTIDGAPRAHVGLRALETLWLNTGTLCNITCANCYIDSSPRNDALVYLRMKDAVRFLDEAAALGCRAAGITGGEPFLNPDAPAIIRAALERGFRTLVLTNAMRPMMRPAAQAALLALPDALRARLTLRVSFDHHSEAGHDAERGAGAFAAASDGVRWLVAHGFKVALAGRAAPGETAPDQMAGYRALAGELGSALDADDAGGLVIFPEMTKTDDPPEISEACWGLLGKSPDSVMCATARMVAHRKGEPAPRVLACTLIAHDRRFELGDSLREAAGPVALNHPWCATFCVLGGASCS